MLIGSVVTKTEKRYEVKYTYLQRRRPMKLKHSIMFTVNLITVFLILNSLGAEPLRIPYVSISGFQWPLWIGEKAGIFGKNQLDAQLIYIPGGSLIVQTMVSGETGIASLSPTSAITAWGNGANLVLVAGGIERVLNVLMVSPKIKRPEDLKGKKIGISRFGSLSDWSLREALRLHKLRANQDVTLVQMGGLGERMAGLTAGIVDGAMLNVDQEYQVEKLGFHALIDIRKLPFGFPTQGIVTSREFLRTKRDAAKRFLKVYIEGIKILKTDKEFAMTTLSRYLKTNDREILLKTYDVYREAFESVPYVRREGVIQAIGTMPELTVKNPSLNPDQLIDNSMIRELEKEGFFKELYLDSLRK